MKADFKKAAAKAYKAIKHPGSVMFLTGALVLSFGAAKGVDYYTSPAAHTAYKTCVTEKKPCTPEQLELASKSVTVTNQFISFGMVGTVILMLGLVKLQEAEHKKKLEHSSANYVDAIRREAEQQERAQAAEDKLAKTEAQLAPYLAEEKRKAAADASTSAKKELNQIAEDATTLQGDITVTKKTISIKKQQPPASP